MNKVYPLHDPAILFITGRSDPGGGPQHLFDLARSLKILRPTWRLAIASPTDAPFSEKFDTVTDLRFRLPRQSFDPTAALGLMQFARKNQITTVHSHSRSGGVYGRLLGLAGFKILHTFHGVHCEPGPTQALKYATDRLLKRWTDRFICVSNDEYAEANRLKICVPEKTTVIPYGIDVDAITAAVSKLDRARARQALRLAPHEIALGTLTRFHYQKNIPGLFTAFSHLKSVAPERSFKLLIAGDGPDREQIEHLHAASDVRDDIHLLGNIADISPFLRSLDCYVSAARWEGLPIAALEAMSASLPCVLTDVVGHHDLLDSEFPAVLLYPLDDVAAFAARVLQATEKGSQMGIQAHRLIKARHSIALMMERMLPLYG